MPTYAPHMHTDRNTQCVYLATRPTSQSFCNASSKFKQGTLINSQAVCALVASHGDTEQQLYDEIELAVSDNKILGHGYGLH